MKRRTGLFANIPTSNELSHPTRQIKTCERTKFYVKIQKQNDILTFTDNYGFVPLDEQGVIYSRLSVGKYKVAVDFSVFPNTSFMVVGTGRSDETREVSSNYLINAFVDGVITRDGKPFAYGVTFNVAKQSSPNIPCDLTNGSIIELAVIK